MQAQAAAASHHVIDTASLHRNAGHHPHRLANALQQLRQTNSKADISAPDAWGSTLLHTACASRGATEQVAMLLQAGANVHAIGPYGMTPLSSALMARQPAAARLVAAAGGTTARGPFNEISERSFLANIFGIDGTTEMHGQVFELEGAFDFGIYPRVADAARVFARDHADANICSLQIWAQAARALADAPGDSALPEAALQRKMRAGAAVLLCTGWRGHSICVAVVGAQAICADRNPTHPFGDYRPLIPLQFKQGAPSCRLLQCMRNNRSRPAWLGHTVLRWLTAAHRQQRNAPMAKVCQRLRPKPQKAHNCTVANAKAGLLALLALLRAQAGGVETEATCAQLQGEYKRFTTFVRRHFLQRYRDLHAPGGSALEPADAALMLRCQAKLGHRQADIC